MKTTLLQRIAGTLSIWRRSLIPYPLRAAKFSFDLMIFGFWWKPDWHKHNISEFRKAQGDTIWWIRWLWFQISFSRWV